MADILARQRAIVGNTADWLAHDITLGDGEVAIERRADGTVMAKVGNGLLPFSAAPYLFASVAGLRFMGTTDPTAPPPPSAAPGQAWAAVPGGVVAASWGAPVAGQTIAEGDWLVKTESGAWAIIPGAPDLSLYVSKAELAGPAGAAITGWIQDDTGGQDVQSKLRELLTPQDYFSSAEEAQAAPNHTDAFLWLAEQYHLGRAARVVDLGYPWLLDPDQVIFTPPDSYNNDYRRPPAFIMDESAIIQSRVLGTTANFLVQFGTLAADYTGILRSPDFRLATFDANAGKFAKGVVYFPFFLDMRIDLRVTNHIGKGVQYGDPAAPQPSAGIKGRRDFDRDLYMWRRDSTAITNAVNPVITFTTPHGLWPSSGRRCMGVNFIGAPAGWNAIAAKSLDCLILSATTVQLLNVDSTGFGLFTGTAVCNLCLPSMKVSKRISGVTNANPCVITTAVPHLLTSGQTVDVAEIGGMQPDSIRGITGIHGQFVATVISPTTFSIPLNTTDTAVYGQYSAGNGPGLAMEWVPLAECDIAEFRANATDADDSELYVRHVRIGVYNDPAFAGWDGKGTQPHFYSFPETAELLCAYYVGGHNNFVQVQCDGPFRYVFWANGPDNASSHSSTNNGYIDPRDIYGVLVRTDAGAGWHSRLDRMKAKAAARFFTDHIGAGKFTCSDNIYDHVYSPTIEFGPGKRAAAVVFDGSNGAIKTGLGVAGSSLNRTPGGDAAGDMYVDFYRPVPLDAYVAFGCATLPDAVITEDFTWSQRSVFQRRIRTQIAGAASNLHRVSVEWRYPG